MQRKIDVPTANAVWTGKAVAAWRKTARIKICTCCSTAPSVRHAKATRVGQRSAPISTTNALGTVLKAEAPRLNRCFALAYGTGTFDDMLFAETTVHCRTRTAGGQADGNLDMFLQML